MAEQFELEDFDTAKAVFEKLKDVPEERRRRILNWVAEGLGIVLHSGSSPAPISTLTPPPPAPHAPATPHPHPPQTQTTDIRSFVAAKAPKSDVQFAATVAYYYRFEAPAATRRDYIDGETLQGATRLADRDRLANPTQTLRNAKNLGYLDGGNSPGEFTINSVGENLVAMTLPGNPDSGVKRARPKKKSGRKG